MTEIVPINPVLARLKGREQSIANIPSFVIEIVNELIVDAMTAVNQPNVITIKRDVIMEAIQTLKTEITRQEIFDNHWLDFEPVFNKHGWRVTYHSPGYGDSDFDPYFKFMVAE